MKTVTILFIIASSLFSVTACAEKIGLPASAGVGPSPTLPEPVQALIPTVSLAPAKGWPVDGKPVAAAGLSVNAYATGFDHPRWLYVLPNGDVLVAETNAPPKAEENKSITGWFINRAVEKAGAAVPSPNRITLLRDADGDGIPEIQTAFLEGLNSPFGMALVGNDLYIADTDAVLRFPYTKGDTTIMAPGAKVVDLPAGTINRHWTKGLVASPDGSRLYVSVGSNSNVGERGLDKEQGRAAIWEIDRTTGQSRVFASGLRNPVGMAWQPQSKTLWVVVNDRDELGNDLVPDYLTSVKDGAFYGWPFSYYGQHLDPRVKPQNPDRVAKAIAPDYALGSHVAPLGLTFYDGTLLPKQFRNGAFVGEHGSWNRKPRAGYKVVFVPFVGGKPSGQPLDILTGFLSPEGDAFGRPVGVAVDKTGALLVADDVGNRIWRVTPAPTTE